MPLGRFRMKLQAPLVELIHVPALSLTPFGGKLNREERIFFKYHFYFMLFFPDYQHAVSPPGKLPLKAAGPLRLRMRWIRKRAALFTRLESALRVRLRMATWDAGFYIYDHPAC